MMASRSPPPDPAWEALQALGSNAVPYLVSQLRGIPFEPTYQRVFTNLPVLMQKKLPNPREKQQLRIRALNALGRLGDPALGASPVVVAMLKERDRSVRFAVIEALRNLHVERRVVTAALVRIGEQGRYGDMLEIAAQTGWEGDDMARLLGSLLKSPDPALRRQAMTLLERAGVAATPALEAILPMLADPDSEVRYLAARSLEAMGADSPQVVTALQLSLADKDTMVRTVARRTLERIAPETLSPKESSAGSP